MVREECNLVFDDYPTIANLHQENEKQTRIRQTDRISSNRAILLLLISYLSLYFIQDSIEYIFKQNYARESIV
jgi:hypothetical protein